MAAIGVSTVSYQDYRLDPREIPPYPASDSPEAQSWARAAALSLKAHRLQQRTDRAWLRARIAWSKHTEAIERADTRAEREDSGRGDD